MMTVKTYVARSGIEGNGVFAGEPIRKGQTIWEFWPGFDVELSLSEVKKMPLIGQEYLQRYGYRHPHKEGFIVLDGDTGRFMNHSETPNTDFASPGHGVALVDIAEGQEILCDYREFDGPTDFEIKTEAVV